jgi:glutaredoxin
MSTKLKSAVLWSLLAGLAVTNVLLIRQNLQMRAMLAKGQPRYLKAGERVPPFAAVDLDGAPVRLDYPGSGPKRIMFYFTPACPYCRRQFAYWRDILKQADSARYEVIGLASESEDKAELEEYLRSVGCARDSAAPLRVALVPPEVRRDYRLVGTPVTLVVSNDGTVERAWPGSWNSAEAASAGSFLGLSFPPR